jgi:hypothetical protein
VALLGAVVISCTQSGAPASPSAAPGGLDAGPDGTTLKVTAPTLTSPSGGVQLDTLRPEFVIGNASGLFANPPLEHRIEIYTAEGQFVRNSPKLDPNSTGQTRWQTASDLQLDRTYRWRARAELGTDYGPWSDFATFRSLDYRGIVPRPPNGDWPTNGPAVVRYVAAAFPDRLRRTSSVDSRVANMVWLRDRIIEAGICGGLDLARNKKRGTGPHSIDAIAWRTSSRNVEVVDLASAYDDNSQTLRLHWFIVDGPPGYDEYDDHPGC